MIDLNSKDYSYSCFKVKHIKHLLKEIKPDIIDLAPSDVVNISLVTFAYLIEGNYFDEDPDGDLTFTLYDDVMHINIEDVTMELKFKNTFVNMLLNELDNKDIFKDSKILRELVVGDENGF